MLPLFGGIPGGPELLVILLVLLVLFGPVVALVVLWARQSQSRDEDVERLQERVDQLEAAVGGAEESSDDGDGGGTTLDEGSGDGTGDGESADERQDS